MSQQSLRIAPSILAADLANLGSEVDAVLKAGADMIHFDVMDNHYVPNLSFGAPVCKSLRQHVDKTHPGTEIDVHLMAQPVDGLIEAFAQAGADWITFHPEASEHIDRSLQLAKDAGCKTGLVFNPATSLHYLDYTIDKIDMVLIMSVNPGFGGQKFIPQTLTKLRQARQRIDDSKREIRLEVDGGIKLDNIGQAAQAGADTFVAGSAIFGQPDYKKIINQLREQLKSV